MNDLKFLKEVVSLLRQNNINTWVFGGWAEEMQGIIVSRTHKDIDLLYPASDFSILDSLLAKNKKLVEIKEKRFEHKRAFVYKGVIIEIFLVKFKQKKIYTDFWGKKKYYWPENVLDQTDSFNVASEKSLTDYRRDHKFLFS